MTRTTTVYANVRVTLTVRAAIRALLHVLNVAHKRTEGPVDVIGLGEWGRSRMRALRRHLPRYWWVRPLRGGGPLGLHRGRYKRVRCRARMVARPGRVENQHGHRRGFLGPSWVTVVTAVDKLTGRRRAWVLYHFTAGVQDRHGHYRHDQPRRVRRHKVERAGTLHVAHVLEAHGYDVTLLGDGNFDGLRFPGFASSDPPADLGNRAVSDVHTRPDEPTVDRFGVADASDHDGLVTVHEEPAA